MLYAKAYFLTLLIFLIIDFVWLKYVAKNFYARHLAHLMRERFNFAVAGGFYLVYVAGIVYFAVIPALDGGLWHIAVLNGTLLGLIAYGTYDLTNLATLKDWPAIVSVVDLAWGGVLTGTTALLGYYVTTGI
jgi:uncharacterized membrane protein